jgi:hypothetical protein
MKTLLFLIPCLFISTLLFSQSSFGVGSGVNFNKTFSNLEGDHLTIVEIEDKSPIYTGHIFFEYAFSNKYAQEIRASYRKTSYTQNKLTGDYRGSYDTSNISIQSINFTNLHKVRLFKKLPIYAEFGLNILKVLAINKTSKGHFYDYGPSLIINDSTNSIYTWNYSNKYYPSSWDFGLTAGVSYVKNLTEHLNLRIEVLRFRQLNAFNNLEDTYSKSWQINAGVSYSINDLSNPKYLKNVPENKNDSTKTKKDKLNLVNFGVTYSLLSHSNGDFNIHLNYLRHLKQTKLYVGLAFIKKIKFQDYLFQLAMEYRPGKYTSFGFYPGLQQQFNYGPPTFKPTFDFILNFLVPFDGFEIGPFAQYGIRSLRYEFNAGLKIRLII